jgi:hypothetical protein
MKYSAWRRYGTALTSFFVSGGLFIWLLTNVDMGRMSIAFSKARLPWLLIAAIFTFSLPFFSVYRWLGVIRAQQGIKIPFNVALRGVMLSLRL